MKKVKTIESLNEEIKKAIQKTVDDDVNPNLTPMEKYKRTIAFDKKIARLQKEIRELKQANNRV